MAWCIFLLELSSRINSRSLPVLAILPSIGSSQKSLILCRRLVALYLLFLLIWLSIYYKVNAILQKEINSPKRKMKAGVVHLCHYMNARADADMLMRPLKSPVYISCACKTWILWGHCALVSHRHSQILNK
jgi:hypothetical protein